MVMGDSSHQGAHGVRWGTRVEKVLEPGQDLIGTKESGRKGFWLRVQGVTSFRANPRVCLQNHLAL